MMHTHRNTTKYFLLLLLTVSLAAPVAYGKKKAAPAKTAAGGSDESEVTAAKLKRQTPLATGNLSKFKKKTIKTGKNKSVKLETLTKAAFGDQDQFAVQVGKKANVGKAILAKPVVRDEVTEFDDSFMITKSTTIVVVDPKKLKKDSPQYRDFLSQRAAKKVSVASLSKSEKKGLKDFFKNVGKLSPNDPLRQAAAKGEQAVLDAIVEGKGELTVEDTLIVPKDLSPPEDGQVLYPVFKNGVLDYSKMKPAKSRAMKAMAASARAQGSKAKVTNAAAGNVPKKTTLAKTEPPPGGKQTVLREGEHRFTEEFMAGFTVGNSWQWERKWTYTSGFFRITVGGGYGFGLRVPIRVSGELAPEKIVVYRKNDQAVSASGKVSVETLDANEAYYREVGLSNSQLFRGKEVVLEYMFGYGFKFRALWKDVIKKPFTAKGINYSQDAKPPLGANCASCGFSIPIPPEITSTKFNYKALTGFLQVGVRVSGNGKVLLDYRDILGRETSGNSRNLTFNSTQPKNISVNIPKLALAEGSTEISKRYGFTLDHLRYQLGVTITPEVRLGIKVGYKDFSRTFNTDWYRLDLFRVHIGNIELRRHEGTTREYTYNGGKKTFLKYQKTAAANSDPMKKSVAAGRNDKPQTGSQSKTKKSTPAKKTIKKPKKKIR